MTQKTWEKKNTIIKTDYICPCCGSSITHHKHYTDTRFCQECYSIITTDYDNKNNDPNFQEEKEYFGYYTVENFLQAVYEEMTKFYNPTFEY